MVVLNLFGGEGLRLKVLDPMARETEVCICVYIKLQARKTQKRLRSGMDFGELLLSTIFTSRVYRL